MLAVRRVLKQLGVKVSVNLFGGFPLEFLLYRLRPSRTCAFKDAPFQSLMLSLDQQIGVPVWNRVDINQWH